MLTRLAFFAILAFVSQSVAMGKPLPEIGDSVTVNMSGKLAVAFYSHIDRAVVGETATSAVAELDATVELIKGGRFRLVAHKPFLFEDGTPGLLTFRADVAAREIANLAGKNHPAYATDQGHRLQARGINFVVDMSQLAECELKSWKLELANGSSNEPATAAD